VNDEVVNQAALGAEKAALVRIMRGSARLSGSRPAAKWSDGRDPKPVGELVEELIVVEGWQADAKGGSLVADWPGIVGPQVAAHCRVVCLEEGKLVLKTDSSPWAAEIRLLTPQLRAAIEKRLGPGVVSEVAVLGPEARSRRHRD
jgi:predicted nucleic acid-binding Zn ribbon protein